MHHDRRAGAGSIGGADPAARQPRSAPGREPEGSPGEAREAETRADQAGQTFGCRGDVQYPGRAQRLDRCPNDPAECAEHTDVRSDAE
jgi:hypothetical protein